MSYVAPFISAAGLTIPSYQDILDYLVAKKKEIYGADVYLDVDSTDYQELSVFSLMLFDADQAAQLAYTNRAPSCAIGVGLDSIIKINGLNRNPSSYSTVDVTVTGTVGTTITNGKVSDTLGNNWLLPASVVIPSVGYITVTATAEDAGEITALAGTITKIETPVAGWVSVTNPSSANAGADAESDAEVRARQAVSTAVPSLSVLEGIAGSIMDLDGVTELKYYENYNSTTDSDGVPGHSIAFVIEGGDSTEIAEILSTKMTPGTGYYGTTEVVVYDEYEMSTRVKFFRPSYVTIDVKVYVSTQSGYTSAIGDLIKTAVADFIESLKIGSDVVWTRVIGAALMNGVDGSDTYNVTNVTMAINGSSPYSLAASDIEIEFTEKASCAVANVTIEAT